MNVVARAAAEAAAEARCPGTGSGETQTDVPAAEDASSGPEADEVSVDKTAAPADDAGAGPQESDTAKAVAGSEATEAVASDTKEAFPVAEEKREKEGTHGGDHH